MRPPLRIGDRVTVDAPSLGYHGWSGTVSWVPNQQGGRDSNGITLADLADASGLGFPVSLAVSAALIVVQFAHNYGDDIGHFQRDHLRLDVVTRLGRLAE